MAYRYEMRLSGEGGQGLVLAGKILAEAAAIYDDKNATQSQSYGPEARGGASKSEVIISDGEIDFPKAEDLDLLLALTQEAFDKYHADLREGGFLVVDAEAVTRLPDVSKWKLVRVPFEKLARATRKVDRGQHRGARRDRPALRGRHRTRRHAGDPGASRPARKT